MGLYEALLSRLGLLYVELVFAILIKSSKLTLGGAAFLGTALALESLGGGVLLLREDEAAGAIFLEDFRDGHGESDFEVLHVLTAANLSFFTVASFWPLDNDFFAVEGTALETALETVVLVLGFDVRASLELVLEWDVWNVALICLPKYNKIEIGMYR